MENDHSAAPKASNLPPSITHLASVLTESNLECNMGATFLCPLTHQIRWIELVATAHVQLSWASLNVSWHIAYTGDGVATQLIAPEGAQTVSAAPVGNRLANRVLPAAVKQAEFSLIESPRVQVTGLDLSNPRSAPLAAAQRASHSARAAVHGAPATTQGIPSIVLAFPVLISSHLSLTGREEGDIAWAAMPMDVNNRAKGAIDLMHLDLVDPFAQMIAEFARQLPAAIGNPPQDGLPLAETRSAFSAWDAFRSLGDN